MKRILSGKYPRIVAPTTTPQIFPIPPKTTQERIKIDTLRVNISGAINRFLDAYKTPAAPPTAAPPRATHPTHESPDEAFAPAPRPRLPMPCASFHTPASVQPRHPSGRSTKTLHPNHPPKASADSSSAPRPKEPAFLPTPAPLPLKEPALHHHYGGSSTEW